MKKLILSVAVAAGGLLLGGCLDDYGYEDSRPGYYSDTTVDFHYVSGRPYSRRYGPLHHREGRYYYSRGGSYVIYDRPAVVHRESRTHVVRRDVDRPGYDDYDRDDVRYRRTRVVERPQRRVYAEEVESDQEYVEPRRSRTRVIIDR